MRLVVCLILVAMLFQSTLAVTSSAAQKKMMLEKINKSMEASSMGRAMKNMIALASKLNYGYDDLELAFNRLSSSLLDHKENENNLYEDQTLNHNSQVEVIESNISKFEKEIRDGEALISSLSAQLTAAQTTLGQQEESLESNLQHHADAIAYYEAIVAAFAVEEADFNSALSLIRQAIEQLGAANDKYNNAGLGEFSFVQVRSTLSSFAQKISTSTAKMHGVHQLFVKPVVQALNQVASSQDGNSLEVAINALKDLEAYFANALAKSSAILEADIASNEVQITLFETQISLLDFVLIPSSKLTIQTLGDKLAVAQNDLEISQQNLSDAKEDLVRENEAFDKITVRHNNLVQKITEEYGIVLRAQNIIKEALEAQESS